MEVRRENSGESIKKISTEHLSVLDLTRISILSIGRSAVDVFGP